MSQRVCDACQEKIEKELLMRMTSVGSWCIHVVIENLRNESDDPEQFDKDLEEGREWVRREFYGEGK